MYIAIYNIRMISRTCLRLQYNYAFEYFFNIFLDYVNVLISKINFKKQ